MSVTIYDVARKAGVGIGTVSRAINNSTQIRPTTKKRVLQAIEELGYKPHVMAQGLARRRTGLFAAIMPFYTGHFYHELLRGLQSALSRHQYDLIVYYVERPSTKGIYFERTLHEKRCDGVMVISMDLEENYVDQFLKSEMPLVLVDRAHPRLDCVQVKNEEGAMIATQKLISDGHRRIAMISGHLSSEPAKKRISGYRKALIEAGLPAEPELLIAADEFGTDEAFETNDGFNESVGFAAVEKLVQMPPAKRPDAIFAASDVIGIGALRAAERYGWKVPEDLSIIGFDDIEAARYLSLSTMHQPMYEMGQLAVERLMEKMEKKDSAVRQTLLATEYVQRSSTRCKE